MPIHIDQLTTEVIPEPEPSTGNTARAAEWEELARLRSLLAQIERDRRRVMAEGGYE